jgi:hypothetical protein
MSIFTTTSIMTFRISRFLPVAALASAMLWACVKTDFDQPPTQSQPVNIRANTTIAQLKAMHTLGKIDSIKSTTGDSIIISGVVVMDDRSGNYYKALVIQDSTGGIEVTFNDNDQYTRFPVGRTVFIRCNGLLLTDYQNLTQITGSVVQEGGQTRNVGLTEAQVRTRVVGGDFGEAPEPKVLSISQLNSSHVSTLIRIDDAEFVVADTGKTFADPVSLSTLNRYLKNCNDAKTLILRTSGYANFAGAKVPRGRGRITGVLSVFRNDLQLYIRDLSDITMDSLRCGEVVIPPTGLPSLNETFSGASAGANVYLDLPGWTNMALAGTERWEGRSFSGNVFAQATAFQAPVSNLTTWLITPGLDLRTQKVLRFRSQWGFYVHQGLTVWYSTDFNGNNAATANWVQLSPVLPNASTPFEPGQTNYCEWVPSGNVQLPIVPGGKAYIGFKYTGNTSTNTTTWRVDDVVVQ